MGMKGKGPVQMPRYISNLAEFNRMFSQSKFEHINTPSSALFCDHDFSLVDPNDLTRKCRNCGKVVE